MAGPVNSFVEHYPDRWVSDPTEIGTLLKNGTLLDAGLEQKDVAARLDAPPNTVSRWWQGSGVKEDQFAHLFGLMRESPAFLNRVLDYVGVRVPDEDRDLELQRSLTIMKRAYRASRSSRAVRTMLLALEDLVEELDLAPLLRVAEEPAEYGRGAQPASSARAAEPRTRLVEEQP